MHVCVVWFLQDTFSLFPWQNMTQEWHLQRRVSHLPAHLHTVDRVRGKGFRHLDGSSALKKSSHPCCSGCGHASCSLAVASIWHFLHTRNGPRWMCPSMSLLVGGRASIPTVYVKQLSALNWSNVSQVAVDLTPAQTRIHNKYLSANSVSCSSSLSVSPKFVL